MLENEKSVLTLIAGALSQETAVRKIVAYGSRVRGDFRRDSDFDVFVLVSKKTPELKSAIRGIFYDHELKYEIPFSVAVLSREEYDINVALGSPFIKSLIEEGVVIYDSEAGGEKLSLKISHRESEEDSGRRTAASGREQI